MARAGIHALCLAACALLALGATCARRPAAGSPDAPPGASAADAGTVEPETGPAGPSAGPAGRLFGLIAPHAGYMYSGAVAGHAWKLLAGRGAPARADGTTEPESVFPSQVAGGFYPEDPTELRTAVEKYLADAAPPVAPLVEAVGTVVVMAPSHHYPLAGAAVLADDVYETPLGRVRVDTALRVRLVELAGLDLVVDSSFFRREHALEVQLPFLQVALPEARVLPLIVGDTSGGVHERLGA
ncbi:MAG: AmmeMemoRadiSam system protein B, partial [Deltaproteobacteria bacterium]|nr:AmmeMemoRadiSam system protein B [Deltaproteobacteria bacterium]